MGIDKDIKDSAERGYNVETLRFLPSLFKNYKYKQITVKDLSVSQTINLSILGRETRVSKLVNIYSNSFLTLSGREIEDLLYIDFLVLLHFINHLSFGAYSEEFTLSCECGEKHKLSYDLYDLDFTEPDKPFGTVKHEDITIELKPFTVGSAIELQEKDLFEDEDAYTVSCIKSINGDIFPENIEKALVKLRDYPTKAHLIVTNYVQELYPRVKPLVLNIPCKIKQIEVLPEISLKGLPHFT